MNKLAYITLLSILILYVQSAEDGKDETEKDTKTETETETETETAKCDGHKLADKETCDKLKVTDSAKKKCVLKSGSKTECQEVDKENSGEMLNIFKISFALLIIFTIL